jgi:predicted dinucleotide-binding enzyme
MPLSRRSLLTALAAAASAPAAAQPVGPALRIGVIGAGSLDGTVGRLWVAAGHEVRFSSRHPEELEPMTRPLGLRASVGTPREVAAFGRVILVATPYDALPELGRDLQAALRGKVLLDATNPPLSGGSALAVEARESGTGPTSAKYLPGARLVRAFSATDASAIERSAGQTSGKVAIPVAGDDADAVTVAVRLVRDAGCDPLVVGNLAAVRFQRGNPGFRANTTLPELRQRLGLPETAPR